MKELLEQGIEVMQKYMDENGITDLSKFPEGPQALEQALFFMPEEERKGLVFGLAFFASIM